MCGFSYVLFQICVEKISIGNRKENHERKNWGHVENNRKKKKKRKGDDNEDRDQGLEKRIVIKDQKGSEKGTRRKIEAKKISFFFQYYSY